MCWCCLIILPTDSFGYPLHNANSSSYYFRDGYNTYICMEKDKEDYILFLLDSSFRLQIIWDYAKVRIAGGTLWEVIQKENPSGNDILEHGVSKPFL